MRNEEMELPDTFTEEDVQAEFDTWLENRSDIGWSVVRGELAEHEEDDDSLADS
jgi:hypothetical protein